MTICKTLWIAAMATAAGGLSSPAWAQAVAPTLGEAIAGGHPILEMRGRYESVDQTGLSNTADAYTVRTRLGWETQGWNHLKALVEVENVTRLGDERFNIAVPGPGGASLNGQTAYPIVNDPNVTELNRAQLTWTPDKTFTLTAGRQRILLDDQRFIGNAGWRQDEQTFDGVRADLAKGAFKVSYAYVGRVNRTFGQRLDWRGDSHLFNASYAFGPKLTVTAFDYAEAFDNAAASSNNTWGLRASGKAKAGEAQLAYAVSYANEKPYRNNTTRFDLDYYEADITAAVGAWALRAGFEQLQGDGARGFFTPLGTTHGFDGWSDAFATAGGAKTHVDGLKDASLGLTWRPSWRIKRLANPAITAVYHDFDAELTSAHLAREWDFQAGASFTPKLSGLLKYADFARDDHLPAGTILAPASRRKLWLALEYRY